MPSFLKSFPRVRESPFYGINAAVSECLVFWSAEKPNFERVLVNHDVREIEVVNAISLEGFSNPPLALLEKIHNGGGLSHYKIFLLASRSTTEWHLDIAHELGHLHTTRFGGFVPVPTIFEEAFCDEFARRWTQVPRHTLQVRWLLYGLLARNGHLHLYRTRANHD